MAVLAVELTDRGGRRPAPQLHHLRGRGRAAGRGDAGGRAAGPRGAHRPRRASRARAGRSKQWNVLDGLKVNGAGLGPLRVPRGLAAGLKLADVAARRVPGRGLGQAALRQGPGRTPREMQGDYMRGLGTLDPSRNPNAYPMTDEVRFPSARDGAGQRRGRRAPRAAGRPRRSPRDPVLARAAQGQEAAGSGLVRLPARGRRSRARRWRRPPPTGALQIRLEVDEALPGGLAVYGARFGRYPVDPTVVFVRKRVRRRLEGRLVDEPRERSLTRLDPRPAAAR